MESLKTAMLVQDYRMKVKEAFALYLKTTNPNDDNIDAIRLEARVFSDMVLTLLEDEIDTYEEVVNVR